MINYLDIYLYYTIFSSLKPNRAQRQNCNESAINHNIAYDPDYRSIFDNFTIVNNHAQNILRCS